MRNAVGGWCEATECKGLNATELARAAHEDISGDVEATDKREQSGAPADKWVSQEMKGV